jgi:hypothetical protein
MLMALAMWLIAYSSGLLASTNRLIRHMPIYIPIMSSGVFDGVINPEVRSGFFKVPCVLVMLSTRACNLLHEI